MKFAEVIGQQQIRSELVRTVNENRVSHAQLFLGPQGCGNLAMALAYAQYLNCENKKIDDSCGICPSCIKSEKLVHPDIHFSFPFIYKEKEKKQICADWLPEWRQFLQNSPYGNYIRWIQQLDAENKQGNINAKECMDILHKLSLKSFESTYKILILWLPEFLEKEGNRLLKLIEEPPENTVFLFVANDQNLIINTILSRLQLVKFPRLQQDDIAEALTKQFEIEFTRALRIAAMSDGDFNEAIQLMELQDGERTQQFRNWLANCVQNKPKEVFSWQDDFARWGRERQKSFFHYGLHIMREVIVLHAGARVVDRLTDEEIKLVSGLAKAMHMEQSIYISHLLDKAIYFVERNANAKILFTYLTVSIMQALNKQESIKVKPFFTSWDV
ncbi:MAG: ATP-binding protein [Chitinophagales bacterium]